MTFPNKKTELSLGLNSVDLYSLKIKIFRH